MPYIPPTSHVTLLATLKRERFLPIPGKVVAKMGQRMEASNVVAHTIIAHHHRLVDIARRLGVPNDKADHFMVKQEGDPVKKGEPLAVRKSFLNLVTTREPSPVDGEVVLVGDGKVLLAAISEPFELKAGLPGTIIDLVPDRGVTIETSGALLEGVWGNGRDDFAVLRALGGPEDVLLPEQLEMGLRGVILAAGLLEDKAVFKQMLEVRLRGLILGSLRAELLPEVQKLPIPVLVTEGFGSQGFSLAAHTLLTTNNGREVWINAQAWDRYAGKRPEVIIPLPSPGQSPPQPADGQALQAGLRVRIVRGPRAGRVGEVKALSERAVLLPSGLRTPVASVQLDQSHEPEVTVPFANLEIIE